MAKYLHRVFEMYELRDEAVRALTRNKISFVTDVVDPEFWDFNLLVASHSAIITHVEFKKDVNFTEGVASDLRKDIAALTGRLPGDSRVLWDFTGVKSFTTASTDMLVTFNKDLKHRGSRLVLCCLEPAVRGALFADRRPCSP